MLARDFHCYFVHIFTKVLVYDTTHWASAGYISKDGHVPNVHPKLPNPKP
jgi:hypothetical protein